MKIKFVKTQKEIRREMHLAIGFWIFILICILVIANKLIEWSSTSPYFSF